MYPAYNIYKLKKKQNRYIFLLGVILVLIGMGMTQIMSIVGVPMDISVQSNYSSSFHWHGSQLVIDTSKATPSGTASSRYGVFIVDNKHIASLWIILCGDGSLVVAGTRNVFGENMGLTPYGVSGIYVAKKTAWADSKIIVDLEKHEIKIGTNKTISLSNTFNPDQISLRGTTGYPAFQGKIRIYGGYITQQPANTQTNTHSQQTTTTESISYQTQHHDYRTTAIVIGIILMAIALIL